MGTGLLYSAVRYAGHGWFIISQDNDTVTLLAKEDDFGRCRFDPADTPYTESLIHETLVKDILPELKADGAEPVGTPLSDTGTAEEIYLLSEDELDALPTSVRCFGNWWWLRTKVGSGCRTMFASTKGSIVYVGEYAFCEGLSVRPAIRVRRESIRSGFQQIISDIEVLKKACPERSPYSVEIFFEDKSWLRVFCEFLRRRWQTLPNLNTETAVRLGKRGILLCEIYSNQLDPAESVNLTVSDDSSASADISLLDKEKLGYVRQLFLTSNNAEGKQVSDAYLLRKIVEGKDGDKDCQTDNQLEN